MYNVLSKLESVRIDYIVHDVLKKLSNMSRIFVRIDSVLGQILCWGAKRFCNQNAKKGRLSSLQKGLLCLFMGMLMFMLVLTQLLIYSDDTTKFLIGDPVSHDNILRLKTDILKKGITGWVKGKLLGSGSFGSVYEWISDEGFRVAVKEVSLLDQSSKGKKKIDQHEQEIALLSQFEHENIVQYIGTDKDESKLYIFLELATKGSLRNLYQRCRLRDSKVSAYTRQILHGLKYLHDRNVVHRDIKCANILVYGPRGS